MPLRDVDEFLIWVQREAPSLDAQQTIRQFLVEAGDHATCAPSVPIAQLSEEPEYQVRAATLRLPTDATIQIWYRHFYVTDAIDVIAITSL